MILMVKVLVTGGNGQLAKCFNYIKSEYPKIKFHFLNRKELDITDYQSILDYFKKNKINFIINCAAYTSVDKAEEEPCKAKEINVLGPGNLVKISESHKIKLIHVSTDYVFNGFDQEEIKEDNRPDPLGIYGKTKLEGENLILKSKSEAIIVRTSWLFSPFGNNFVKTILKLSESNSKISVVNDQWGRPTFGLDLAKTIIKLINSSKSFNNRIYHFSNKEITSWFDFAKEILRLSKYKSTLIPIETINYNSKAKRPKNVSLSTELIESTLNLQIPNWKDSLKKCLNIINE